MTEPDDVSPARPKAVEAAAEAIAASAGLAIGGPLGAMLGAAVAPYVLHVAQTSWDEITGRRQLSVAQMIGEAAEALDDDPQQLVAAAFSTESGTELLADALSAAAATLNQRKVSALARALANGLADDLALVDQERLTVRALAELEEPHLALLSRMAGFIGPVDGAESDGDRRPWFNLLTISSWYAPVGEPAPPGLLDALMRTLERNGLIEENRRQQDQDREKALRNRIDAEVRRVNPNADYTGRRTGVIDVRVDPKWGITDFGMQLLAHVEDAR